jgi:outer membrane lipoprotein carrier protein
MIRIFATLCAFLASGICIAADDDTNALLAVLDRIGSVQGDFVQTQYGQDEALLGESRGQFRLLRPGYFAWEITSPDSQLIIADPEYLWQHDRDLETVTRRPVSDSDQMSPLQILGGDEALLRASFSVEQTGEGSFALKPQAINPGFQRLLVSFKGSALEGLEIADNLNQRIVIVFENVDTSSTLSPQDFAFTAPEGADLFYYDQ